MRTRLALVAVAVSAVAACGGGTPPPSPGTLLRDAKQSIDSAPSLHFVLSSENVSGTGPLLTSAAPSRPVAATVGVDASTHQLRRVSMVGPFFSATQDSTFTVVLSNYGENVTVTPPAA